MTLKIGRSPRPLKTVYLGVMAVGLIASIGPSPSQAKPSDASAIVTPARWRQYSMSSDFSHLLGALSGRLWTLLRARITLQT